MKPRIEQTEQTERTAIDDCWNRIGVRGDRSCVRLEQVLHCRNCPVHADAARRIMQRRAPADYLGASADACAAPAVAGRGGAESLMIMRLGREWLGLATASCISVADPAPVHPLPHRSNAVLAGVVNVDGKLLPQLSLAALLTIDAQQEIVTTGRHVYARLLVLQMGAQAIAVPVHELHGIAHCHPDDLLAPPASVDKATARFLRGVMQLGSRQVGVLDAGLLAYNMAQALQ